MTASDVYWAINYFKKTSHKVGKMASGMSVGAFYFGSLIDTSCQGVLLSVPPTCSLPYY